MQGPTRSESTQKLIDTCREAAAGRCSTATIVTLLDEREQGLAHNAAAFEQKLSGESADFVQALRPNAEGVRTAFRQYGEALVLLREWLASGDAAVLERGLQRMAAAGNAVLEALMAWDMAVMTQRGPTDHPILNTLLRACGSPGVRPADLAPLVEQARGMVIQARDTARGAHPLVERLRAGAGAYLQAFETLDRFAATGDPAALEQASADIVAASAALQTGATLLRAAAQGPGPTSLPIANALIGCRDALADGRVPRALVTELVATLENSFTKLRADLRRAFSGGASAMVIDEGRRAETALAVHEAALADLRRFIDEGDVEALDSGLEKLTEAVQGLGRSRETFALAASREGKVVCVWCNHPNAPGNHTCDGCRRLLPRWNEEEVVASTFSVTEGGDVAFASDEVRTENIERLAQAVEDVRSGAIDLEAFGQALDVFEAQVRQGEARLPTFGDGATEVARDGVQWIRHGLHELRACLEDGDGSHLEPGMTSVRTGAKMLHDAQQSARWNHDR